MADQSLQALISPAAFIFVDGQQVEVKPIKLKQLPTMLALCDPILQTLVDNQAKIEADLEGAMIELVMEDQPTYQAIIKEAANLNDEQVGNMAIEELVYAIGVLISINKVFFSQLRQRLIKLLGLQASPLPGLTKPTD